MKEIEAAGAAQSGKNTSENETLGGFFVDSHMLLSLQSVDSQRCQIIFSFSLNQASVI